MILNFDEITETALWQEYEAALTYFLTYSPAFPADYDLRIREREYSAWVELNKRKLLNSPKYAEVIAKAHRHA